MPQGLRKASTSKITRVKKNTQLRTKRQKQRTKKGALNIKQKRQEKGRCKQLARKLDKQRTGMIHNNIEDIMASKVLFAGGKLSTADLVVKGKNRLKDAKELLKHKESLRKSKVDAIKDSIVKNIEKQNEKTTDPDDTTSL